MFSCFNNVQRDAIEFPSQFLENFVYQYEVIEYISSHIETKEPLHPNDFKKLYDLIFKYELKEIKIGYEPAIDDEMLLAFINKNGVNLINKSILLPKI